MYTEYYLKIKKQFSDKKFVKAMLIDLYASDIKMKNLLLMVFDSGIAERIKEKNSLSKLDIYQFGKTIEKQYGIKSEDITVAIIEWTHILNVEIETEAVDEEKTNSSDLLEFTKEIFYSTSDTFLNKEEMGKNIWEILAYAYILSGEETRENIKNNCSEFFNIDVDEFTAHIVKYIIAMDDLDFVERKINMALSSTLKYVEEAVDKENRKIIKEKCFWSLKILKSIIASIIYRDGSIENSILLIFITALFDANEKKVLLSGYEDGSAGTTIMTFPSFDEVVQYGDQCLEQNFSPVGIDNIEQKCKHIFDQVKNSVMDRSIVSVYDDLSNVMYDYVISRNKIINDDIV